MVGDCGEGVRPTSGMLKDRRGELGQVQADTLVLVGWSRITSGV